MTTAARRRSEREDRGSTIRSFLIADVRGYTPFTKEHGDEAAARLAVKFTEIALEGLEVLGGELIGTRGDEIAAAFSSPRRALRATLELQDAFAHETALEPSLPLRVGMGLAAGEAVKVADGYRGGALNLAARLCSQAQAGEVLVSEELRGLVGAVEGIAFESLGAFELKGLAEPVEVTRVASAAAESAPVAPAQAVGPRPELPAELDPATPIMGRERELRFLRWFWRRARHGHGRAIFLCGPSGIGKSRLAAELAAEAHAQGAAVLYAACAGPRQEALEKLRAADGLERPVLVVADDLDAAGGTILDTAASVLSSIGGRPILFLGTYDDEHSPLLSSLLARADPSAEARLDLAPLDAEHVRAIAALYAGQALAGLPLAELLEETGGVPAFVHRAAGAWARERASARLSASASRTAEGRKGLRVAETELAESVVDLQRAREGMRLYAEEHVEAVVCPFKGLATFQTADADYFFGRERLVAELVARLVGTTFLGVVGPSGSGKSSVIHAGLLPALAAGMIPGSERWPHVLLRPGEHPVPALEQALEVKELTADLLLRARDKELQVAPGDGERLVLVVDQFEEVFTACRDEAERAQFVRTLVTPSEELMVVIALRADFYGRCTAYPELAQLLGANQVPVGSMREEELRLAIELPARRAGLRVEPELVDALVSEVVDQPGGLPLLSTALLELWQRREGRTLTMESYRATGGVRGAVARLAEEGYNRLSPEQQIVARAMLLRLAGPGEGDAVVRRRVALADLDLERNENAARVLSVLTDARLLTTGRDSVEVAHEALLREWPRLQSWLEEDAEGRRLHLHLMESAKEWDERGRDEADLYRGARLGTALDWTAEHTVELNQRERRFLDQSRLASEREAERQRRTNGRLRILLAGTTVLLLAALIAGAFALAQRGRARNETRVAKARELATAARASVADDPERGILLGIEAVEAARHVKGSALIEAEGALHQALAKARTVVSVPGAGAAVAFAPDGRRFVAAGSTKSPEIRDTQTGGRVLSLALTGHTGIVRAVDYSPDGSMIVTGSADRTARLWKAATGDPIRTFRGHKGEVISAQFSPDGRLLATVGQDGTARVWDARTGKKLRKFVAWRGGEALPPYGRDLATFIGVDRLAVANVHGRSRGLAARIWDVSSGRSLGTADLETATGFHPLDIDVSPNRALLAVASKGELGLLRLPDQIVDQVSVPGSEIWDVEFSPDGKRLATAGADGTVRIWKVGRAGLREVSSLPRQTGEVVTVSFGGHDGHLLLTGNRDGTARIFDLSTAGRELFAFPGPNTEVSGDVAFTRDGRRILASSGPAGTVRMWDAATGKKLLELKHQAHGSNSNHAVAGIDVSPDGSRIATANSDGTAAIWDAATGRPLVTFGRHDLGCPVGEECALEDVHYGPDGTWIATASDDGTARIFEGENHTPSRVFSGHEDPVLDLDVSPDGSRLVTAGIDGFAKVWATQGSDREPLFSVRTGDVEVAAVAYTPDGTQFVTAGSSGKGRFWDARDGHFLYSLSTGDRAINAVAFSPDGARLATGGEDGKIKLWDVGSRKVELTLEGPTGAFAFSPDGKLLAAAAPDPKPSVRVFVLDVDRLLQVARDHLTRSLTEQECRQYMHVGRCPARG